MVFKKSAGQQADDGCWAGHHPSKRTSSSSTSCWPCSACFSPPSPSSSPAVRQSPGGTVQRALQHDHQVRSKTIVITLVALNQISSWAAHLISFFDYLGWPNLARPLSCAAFVRGGLIHLKQRARKKTIGSVFCPCQAHRAALFTIFWQDPNKTNKKTAIYGISKADFCAQNDLIRSACATGWWWWAIRAWLIVPRSISLRGCSR